MEKELEEALRENEDRLSDIETVILNDPEDKEALGLRDNICNTILEIREILNSLREESEAEEEKIDEVTTIKNDSDLMEVDEVENECYDVRTIGKRKRKGFPNNKKIHSNFKYNEKEPDFEYLSQKHKSLQKFMIRNRDGRCSIDFSDKHATLELTKALLKEDFDLNWDIPIGYLVPPITCRANYLYWINDLLQLASPNGLPRGLDVGCGANCIYSLMGAVLFRWEFVAIDNCLESISIAKANIESNPHLKHLISLCQTPKCLLLVQDSDTIISTALISNESFHFSMCNPPFFESIEKTNKNLKTAYGGTIDEMVYPGGEFAFISKMVSESLEAKKRIYWFSSMVGKKSTLKMIRKQLYELGVRNVRTREFFQGKTSRWGIAWSFTTKNIETIPLPVKQNSKQIPMSSLSFTLKVKSMSLSDIIIKIESLLDSMGCIMIKRKESKMKIEVPLKGSHKEMALRRKGGSKINGTLVKLDAYENEHGEKVLVFAIAEEDSNEDIKKKFSEFANRLCEDLEILTQT